MSDKKPVSTRTPRTKVSVDLSDPEVKKNFDAIKALLESKVPGLSPTPNQVLKFAISTTAYTAKNIG